MVIHLIEGANPRVLLTTTWVNYHMRGGCADIQWTREEMVAEGYKVVAGDSHYCENIFFLRVGSMGYFNPKK